MKSSALKTCLFALSILAASLCSANERETIRLLLDEFLAGASRSDPQIHERFWSEDLVYTSSRGLRYGKDSILRGLAGAGDSAVADESAPDAPVYGAEDVVIRLLSDDAAVLTFTLVATSPDGAQSRYFNSGVLERRAGLWRASVWQATVATDAED